MPVVIHAWLLNPFDHAAAVVSVIECGGDADTTAAIVGGIVGCAVGERGIRSEWISHLADWPASVNWMRRLAYQLAVVGDRSCVQKPVSVIPLLRCVRNLVFFTVVFFHGIRRLFPPY